jgi:integrase
MPRHNLKSKEYRAGLKPQGEPYWQEIDRGLHLGYRKNPSGAVWCVRRRSEGRYIKKTIGDADDTLNPDNVIVFTYSQARNRAEDFTEIDDASEAPQRVTAAYTVGDAVSDYLEWYKLNRKAYERTEANCNAHIIPKLGKIKLNRLQTRQINKWLRDIAQSPPRASGGKPKPPYATKEWTGKRTKPKGHKIYRFTPLPYAEWSDEMKRKRKCSANRILTILKAALNYAWKEGHGGNREVWQRVKPFEDADAAKVAYLSERDATALLKAASDDFRPMARAALLTGCRYGELTRLTVADLHGNQLFIEKTKTGKPRHVPLSEDGIEFFKGLAKGKQKTDLLLTHKDGEPWAKSHQTRPMREACEKAGIDPVGFHVLRHTYATLLLRSDGSQGVSIRYVAALIGDSVATCEKHYGHVIQDDLAKEVARKLPSFGT